MNTAAAAAVADPGARGAARRVRAQLPLALVTALLGFLLATQFQARENLGTRLAGEREADLAQILSNLTSSTDQLQDETSDLRLRLQAAEGSSQQQRVLVDNARQQLDALKILLGLVGVRGPGIVVTVTDPRGTVGPDVLLDAVEELRDAGAEALAINDVRIVASSAFGGSAGAVSVGGARISAPYRIVAIGGADTMAAALRIPGGVVDTIGSKQGAGVLVDPRREVTIASLHTAPRFTYATPT